MLDDAEIGRVLAITAHPDDVDFAASGTVARWIAGGPDPNHYVDVTETFPRKIAALRTHESQTGHMADLAERLTARLTRMARLAGLPEGRLAEGFRVLETS